MLVGGLGTLTLALLVKWGFAPWACTIAIAAAGALQEWWNAATLSDYWRMWNIPIHKWMLRTIFFPLVRRGVPRLASLLFVFFISAVMHELAVGVPLRMLRGWAFWGMMLQVGGWLFITTRKASVWPRCLCRGCAYMLSSSATPALWAPSCDYRP